MKRTLAPFFPSSTNNGRLMARRGCPHACPSKFGASPNGDSNPLRLLLSRIFPHSSRFTLEGESAKKPDLQKSSWTGFVWFYRVSLRFIELPPPPISILRDFSRPLAAKKKRFAVCRRNEAKKEQKINRGDAIFTNRVEQFVVLIRRGANTLESRHHILHLTLLHP